MILKKAARVEVLEIPGGQGLLYPTLIWDDDATILVDAAYPGQVSEFRHAITKAGASFEKIGKIIVTHRDWDHTGGLRDILTELPQRPSVFAHCEEKPYIDECITPLKAIVVEDTGQLPFCGGITIIHTPGHKPGHICLYVEQSKTLIAADALAVEGDELILPPKSVNLDWRLAMKSLEKLIKYDIQTVVCYHGGIWKGNVSRSIAELADL
jgi:glyoxylase-like metal-dependent hydrolase (beta-lactamase superfamily II)